MKEHLKVLIAAGFSNAEISEITSSNRADFVANGILQGIACGCEPWIYHDDEFVKRDPFKAMAGMSAEERRALREYADGSFDEFIGSPDYPPVSQAEVTEYADRILAYYDRALSKSKEPV